MNPTRHRLARLVACGLVSGLVVPLIGITTGAAAVDAGPTQSPSPVQRQVVTGPSTPHVVVLGVSGITWDTLSPARTPQLWQLASGSAIGSLVVRGVFQRTCAADGWLTLGAGGRAVVPRVEQPDGDLGCPQMPTPRWDGSQWKVPGWSAIVAGNVDRYDPPFGVVAGSLAAAGRCTTAVGPGAALMLAKSDGVVSRYEAGVDEVDAALLDRCALTAVDLGEVPPPAGATLEPQDASGGQPIAGTREQALRQLDDEVAGIRRELPPGSTLVLVSTGDETNVARLRVLTAVGPGGGDLVYGPGLLTTTSTRRDGLVQITDVTPLVLDAADAPAVEPVVGTAPTVDARTVPLAHRVDDLIVLDQRAQVIARITFPINQAIVIVALLTYLGFGLAGAILVRRRRAAGVDPPVPLSLRRWLRWISLFLASVPLATYAANLFPWWRLADGPATGSATAAILLLALAIAVILALVAGLLPVLQRPFRPVGFLAGLTAAVLAVDVATGSHLQFASVLGLSPIAAGRFYGFGNVAFAVFAASAIFAAIGLSAPWVRAGRRLAAAGLVAGFGLFVALVDGWPSLGADFGGMIALVVGFGFFAVLVSGRKASWRWLLAVGVLAVLFALAISYVDYLRPADSRTHLGEFVASLADGEAWPTVQRKLMASLRSFTFSAPAPLIPVVWAMLGWVALQPKRFGATALEELDGVVPTFLPGVLAGLLIAALGAVVNDSGVIVTATMLGVGLPLAVAAAADVAPRDPRSPAPTSPPGPGIPEVSR